MKRTYDVAIKMCDMGRSVSAERVPAHNKYNPEIDQKKFESLIKNIVSYVNSNKDVDINKEIEKVKAYTNTFIDDFNVDIKNSALDRDATYSYYRKYVQVLDMLMRSISNSEFKKKFSDIVSKANSSIKF